MYELGSVEASEALIRDLYLDLRTKVNAWSQITHQTPQARMGYIGQHLVSVVTGYPGGKSGARGHDLEMGTDGRVSLYGEIKTCYRVDQLGCCHDCGAVVSSIEAECSVCHSHNIDRKADSKWLISLKNDAEFARVIDPQRYYFVLFEFTDPNEPANTDIEASIWEVDPKVPGFALCMADYYLLIRARSYSKAPFNMWPHQLKFLLTRPLLIYRAIIRSSGDIDTLIFPTMGNASESALPPLPQYAQAKTLTAEAARAAFRRLGGTASGALPRIAWLERLEELRSSMGIPNGRLCDVLAEEIYLPGLLPIKEQIPRKIRETFPQLL